MYICRQEYFCCQQIQSQTICLASDAVDFNEIYLVLLKILDKYFYRKFFFLTFVL